MPESTRADVLAALQRFYDVGLTPVLSTNGGIPGADVQVVRVPADQASGPADRLRVLDVWVTDKGEQRLRDARHV